MINRVFIIPTSSYMRGARGLSYWIVTARVKGMTFENSSYGEKGTTPQSVNPDGLNGIPGTRRVEPTRGTKEGGDKDLIRLDDPYNHIPPDGTFTGKHFHSSAHAPCVASQGHPVHSPLGHSASFEPPSCRRTRSQ